MTIRLGYFLTALLVSVSVFANSNSSSVNEPTPEPLRSYWLAFQYGRQLQSSVNNREQTTISNFGGAFSHELLRASGIWGLAFDIADQKDGSSTGNVSISRERVTVGLDLNFTPEFLLYQNWNVYGLVGIAFFQDQVQTQVGSLYSSDWGSWEPMARVGFGSWYTQLHPVRIGLEFRLLDSAQLNPQVTIEGVARVAYTF